MNKALRFIISLVVLLNVNGLDAADSQAVPEYLTSVSVVVESPKGYGSGVAITRKDSNGKDVTFIWTAGHLCQQVKEVEEEVPFNFIFSYNNIRRTSSIVTYYTNLVILQDVTIKGEYAYTTNLSATVIKCSPIEGGHDLAVLRINGKFFNTNTVTFDLSGRIPKLGEPLYGINSPYGEYATFSTGLYSFVGRNLGGLLFDQTTLLVFPGSSGGGVYTLDGKCVGITTLMKEANFNYMIPIRRIQKWAKEEGIEWALNPAIPMPADSALKSLSKKDKNPPLFRPGPRRVNFKK